jgi:4-hydroxythreonine-4-phosphate dehydrogenase
MRPVIAITIGDINGIGPEVVLKSMKDKVIRDNCIPLLIGPLDIWEELSRTLKLGLNFLPFRSIKDLSPKYINIFDIYFRPKIQYGKLTEEAGYLSALSILVGYHLCKSKIASAMVTSPISKEALNSAGFFYQGHTEMLADLSKTKNFCMMLLAEGLRVGLVTTHKPIKEIADSITENVIIDKINIIHNSLKKDFGIKKPRIAVLGLNPHAGDGGILGTEEKEIIFPSIQKLRTKKINVEGPFAADGFFARYKQSDYDAVLAMYHDQGLIPLKMTAKGKGVNFTAGLDIIRTSPDHGTAFDIAGKNIASDASMKQALKFAISLVKKT